MINCNKYTFQAEANISALLRDSEYNTRLATIRKLVTAFDAANIKWEFVCSTGLFLLGIVDNFHDLDILIAPESLEAANTVLTQLGIKQPLYSDPKRQKCFKSSKNFATFTVDGIDVETCDFCFNVFGVSYQYNFNEDDIIFVKAGDMKLPCIAVEAQYLFYSLLMGWQRQRAFKRDLIETYLKSGNIIKADILKNALIQDLPYWIKDRIDEIIIN